MNSLVVLEDNKYIGTASLCETILCGTAEAVSPPRQGHTLRCALRVYFVKPPNLRILAISHQSQLNKGGLYENT